MVGYHPVENFRDIAQEQGAHTALIEVGIAVSYGEDAVEIVRAQWHCSNRTHIATPFTKQERHLILTQDSTDSAIGAQQSSNSLIGFFHG